MNLQPIYPPKPRFTFSCSRCSKRSQSLYGFADLDATPGTFVCGVCHGSEHTRFRETENRMIAAGNEIMRRLDDGIPVDDVVRDAHTRACNEHHRTDNRFGSMFNQNDR